MLALELPIVLALTRALDSRSGSDLVLSHARRLAQISGGEGALVVNRTLLSQKLAELADRVTRVRERSQGGGTSLRNDRDAFELVSFNLLLAVQVCADIASHVISDENWVPVKT